MAMPPPSGPHTIHPSLFVSSGAELRTLEKQRQIGAPQAAVFRAWSDASGCKAAFGPRNDQLRAHIDLAIGGRYEWLFDGVTGSNGCQVLSYIPGRMISFSWNAPPEIPDVRGRHTWVVVELSPVSTGADAPTIVRLTHLGFGQGTEWDATLEYFDKAWDLVLDRFAANLGTRLEH